ncbi:hypothetical protein [Antarcticirhabdus aurantiaca]|uniref:Uncharacterized protein n=1 Tax=Antarcticirhabdus aurantiaca TaxID=2606717 RepID=A0ACD4NR93_9HYPH|nr:hypothetical protein [Antarcticirhabdus aurantiaca]WAJ29430.1 hypothetical protein OXU80_04115 [Jeongeuplla avenae]
MIPIESMQAFNVPQPMKFDFGHDTLVTISNPDPLPYVQVDWTKDYLTLCRHDDSRIKQVFPHALLKSLRDEGKLLVEQRKLDEGRQKIAVLNRDVAGTVDVPGHVIDKAVFHHRLVLAIEAMRKAGEASLSDASLAAAIPKAFGAVVADLASVASKGWKPPEKVPSPGTLRRLRRAFAALGDEPLAVRDRRSVCSGNRKPRIEDPIVLAILGKWTKAYLDRRRPTVAGLHRLMQGEFLDLNAQRKSEGLPPLTCPSRSTLERAINRLAKFDVVLAREGKSAARRKFKIAARHEFSLAPGELVFFDNWSIQLSKIPLPKAFWDVIPEEERKRMKRIRLNLCLALCRATRVILAASLSVGPNTATSLRTLEMACKDKDAIARAAGCRSSWNHALTIGTIGVDCGPEFANAAFVAAAVDLGTRIELGIAGEPDARAEMERAFKTLDSQLLQNFSGRTFSNVTDKGEYEADKLASATRELFSKSLVRWIVDVYHNQPHRGLGGETPNDAWIRCCDTYGIVPPPNVHQMRAVFGFASTRRIQAAGVPFLGNYYRGTALGDIHRRIGQGDILIRACLDDLGAIAIKEIGPDTPWHTLPCERKEFRGMTAARWIETAKALRRKHADAAKLREPIVLEALQHLREAGLEAEREAGLLPSMLTDDDIAEAEATVFANFEIVPAKRRGQTLEGVYGPAPDEPAGSDAGKAVPDPADAAKPADAASEPRRRPRRGLTSDFLKKD